MRFAFLGLMMSVLLFGAAWADDAHTEVVASEVVVMGDAPDALYDVTGLPTYQGPGYRSLDSEKRDIDQLPEFHSFHHRPVDEVGYSPLTLADFRVPVPGRTKKEFKWERLDYPRHSTQVWHDDCHGFTVTAFENASRSTASEVPAGTAVSCAIRISSLSSSRSSCLSRPGAD